MSELKDILAEHKRVQFGASFPEYKVIEECCFDCPACAQKRPVEWLEAKCTEHGYYENGPRTHCPACLEALRQGLEKEGGK